MRGRHAALVMSTATLALAGVASSAPAAAQAHSPSCRAASHASGVKIVQRGHSAVIFRRHGRTLLRGCAYGHSVHVLKKICCEGERVHLAGRYLAYTYQGTAIGDETNKLGVYDLVTDKLERIKKLDPHGEGGGREIETSSFVHKFAVTSRGSLVWIEDILTSFDDPHCAGCATGQLELRAADGREPAERIVDTGKITKNFLRLGSHSIVYRKDGKQVTAPLHPGKRR